MMNESWMTGTAGFLFSPASRYPTPSAYVVDRSGVVLHEWSHTAHQPRPEDAPPSYLRGWNHVAVDTDGSLFAIVPLRALLKLTPASALEWSADLAAHHDLAVADSGNVLVLTETPRLIVVSGQRRVIIDNVVTSLDPSGVKTSEVSLYDTLRTDPALGQLLNQSIVRRHEEFERRGWPTASDDVTSEIVGETRAILQSGRNKGDLRQALRCLRELPGSPCDVMHTNTLALLDMHPAGLWERGAAMLCMRELHTVAVVDLASASVRWWWGPEELSGAHQPSMLPDGRVLIFDNGSAFKRTRLLIIEPSTREIVWSWEANPPESFFCPLAGGCERLPNGNLLVTDSTGGKAFELAMNGRIVWRLTLPDEAFGAERSRASIYRMSAVAPEIVTRLRRTRTAREKAAKTQATAGDRVLIAPGEGDQAAT